MCVCVCVYICINCSHNGKHVKHVKDNTFVYTYTINLSYP